MEKKWIPEPANWLAKEKWDEDLPIIHDDPKGAAIAKAKANGPAKVKLEVAPESPDAEESEQELPSWLRHGPRSWPVGRHVVEVVNSDIDVSHPGEKSLTIFFRVQTGELAGKELAHRFWIEAQYGESTVAEGLAYLSDIIRAVGLESTDDSNDLHGKNLVVAADGKRLTYSPLAANENHTLESAA